MATEQGVVVKVDATTAWVKTVKSGACQGCTARGTCHAMGGSDDREVEALNAAGAAVGDRIVMSFETSSLLKVTFLLYLFPILVLLAGALIGQKLGPILDFNASAFSAIVGFASFLGAFKFIKSKANQLAQKDEYRPKIIRILKQPPESSPAAGIRE
ncbi:MAG: SoxR reducing system RseC family protein [Desulfobacterales bacterium]|nr:MAG: SoxR reducing system RseC family protein [Desulfobacterales bacterium]